VKSLPPAVARLIQGCVLTVAACIVAAVVALCVIGWIASRERDAHIRIIHTVDDGLGFKYGKDEHESFHITWVTPGGVIGTCQ